MNVYDYSKINKCIICGSVDGKIDKLIKWVIQQVSNLDNYEVAMHPKEKEQNKNKKRRALSRKNELDNSLLIVNGSNCFGTRDLKYYHDKFKLFDKVLEDNNCKVVFVRGNDDPKYFEDELIDFDNIKTIKDYSVIKLNYFNCLCIGGSISLDRTWKKQQEQRIGKKLYWEEEYMDYDEEKLTEILDEYPIACVVTPDSPSFISPSMNYLSKTAWFEEDESLPKDINKERSIIDKIYIKMVEKGNKPYAWFHSKFTKQEPRTIVNDILFHAVYPFQGDNFLQAVNGILGIDIFGKATKVTTLGQTLVRNDYDIRSSGWDEEDEIYNEEDDEDEGNLAYEFPEGREYVVNEILDRVQELRAQNNIVQNIMPF